MTTLEYLVEKSKVSALNITCISFCIELPHNESKNLVFTQKSNKKKNQNIYFCTDLSQMWEKLLTQKKNKLTFIIRHNLFFWKIEIS